MFSSLPGFQVFLLVQYSFFAVCRYPSFQVFLLVVSAFVLQVSSLETIKLFAVFLVVRGGAFGFALAVFSVVYR